MMTTTELLTGFLATLCQAGHFDFTLNIKNLCHWAGILWQMLCVIKRKVAWKQLASLLLSLLLQIQKWELHDEVHAEGLHSPHGCDYKASWIPCSKSRMIDSFLLKLWKPSDFSLSNEKTSLFCNIIRWLIPKCFVKEVSISSFQQMGKERWFTQALVRLK